MTTQQQKAILECPACGARLTLPSHLALIPPHDAKDTDLPCSFMHQQGVFVEFVKE